MATKGPPRAVLARDASVAREFGIEFSVVGGDCQRGSTRSRAKHYGMFTDPTEAVDLACAAGHTRISVSVGGGGGEYWDPQEPEVVNSQALRDAAERVRTRRSRGERS